MILGQVIAGDFSRVIIRVKSEMAMSLGQLCVIDHGSTMFLLQVYDLVYGSQISQQNLEMVAGMKLEESGFSLLDSELRMYTLAYCKPVLVIENGVARMCKELPPFFGEVREVEKKDLSFVTKPTSPLFLGMLRSGSTPLDFEVFLPGEDALSHHILIPASTGKGKSNLMRTMLWNILSENYAGILVLDPHDEYYGRVGVGLKDHPNRDRVSYYTPVRPPPGAKTLKINLRTLKPSFFQGAVMLSDPQRQCLHAYYKAFGEHWIVSLMEERRIEGIRFHEDTVSVVKRRLIALLGLELQQGMVTCQGIFDHVAGENTIEEMCRELEQGKVVVVDTSYFSGAIEIMVGTIIATTIFERYKYYKRKGELETKPVVSIVLEEAPRVLGKKVLEQGSNIFDTLAREGRKFKVGLIAITQLPSEIPKTILANMNTKVILGIEMSSERSAVIESSAQDLSADSRSIASLDKGEAIVTSTFGRFAMPVKVPLFTDYIENFRKKENIIDDSFFS